MALKVTKMEVWVAGVADEPGALAAQLEALAAGGAQLEFVLARRAPEKPGAGVVFVAPITGAKQAAAAKKAGFHKSRSFKAVRVEGPDRPGQGARLTRALAAKGINLRGFSAGVIGRRFVLHLAFDTAAAASQAARALTAL